jgi:hypothetical protein
MKRGCYKTSIAIINNIIINYTEPIIKDMIIIIPYFNACNSINILKNLKTVKKSLDNASIPYYIGEVLFENQESIFFDIIIKN